MGFPLLGCCANELANDWVQIEDVKQPGYRVEEGFSGAPVWDEKLQGVAGMAVAAEKEPPRRKSCLYDSCKRTDCSMA